MKSLETRKKISETFKRKGIHPPRTEEALRKLAKSRIGNKNALGCKRSLETKIKISASRRERKLTQEEIQNIKEKKFLPKRKSLKKSEMIGPLNYNWKGGKTKAIELARKNLAYSNWRLGIFRKNKFLCKNCNSNKNIEAHHLLSFSKFPQFRYDLWNGIILCTKCHKEVHKIIRLEKKISLRK